MNRLVVVWRFVIRWYVSAPVLAGLGVLVGWAIFFHGAPEKPEIGVIDIPGTVISRSTASTIGDFLDFARDTDSIKAVVIKLSSPGGGAASSEKLFLKTLDLRGKKPVVVFVEDLAASGGYMWAMGANHIFVNPTSLVGSVGVIFSLPGIPEPDENLVFSGPAKLTGAPRRTFTQLTEMVKESFLDIVISQRGDRLKITRDEVAEARLYAGMEAVRLGLADEIGSDTDAMKKAADLAGIANYDVVDINAEVLRLFIQKLDRIFGTSAADGDKESVTRFQLYKEFWPSLDNMDSMDSVLPGFPGDLNLPQIYHLYVPPSN